MPALRLILGDQLSPSINTLTGADEKDVILMAEVRQEATYVKHHKKKIAFIFSAMRHFAAGLEAQGLGVTYVRFNDPHNTGSLRGEVRRLLQARPLDEVVVTEPGEYRLLEECRQWAAALDTPVTILPDERFVASHQEFAQWAAGRKELIMEYWYRAMRRKTGLLMDQGKPEGGRWNFDRENRKPPNRKLACRGPLQFEPDATTSAVLRMVADHFADHFGDLEPFWFAVTDAQARQALEHFIRHSLPRFGDYQDAMLSDEAFLFHSILSQYINAGLLDPLEVCKQVAQAYSDGHAPLNAVEGFIRQIIGWREYIRGVYWYHMPEYAQRNALAARRALPGFYWNGKTDMRCLSEVINTTRQHACSHHIQRLMVTGNFANLAGLDVRQVCDWYLAVYADAYEWVELPNTLGMALHGDGGIVGTKPYIASGSYINRMSDFCSGCRFDYRQRTGAAACPFTTLYWDYLMRHEQTFSHNRRMAMAYKNLARLPADEKQAIRRQARSFLNNLDSKDGDRSCSDR